MSGMLRLVMDAARRAHARCKQYLEYGFRSESEVRTLLKGSGFRLINWRSTTRTGISMSPAATAERDIGYVMASS